MKTLRNTITIIALVVITFIITKAFFVSTETVVETQTDTIWNRDTIVKQLPAPEPDTVLKTDTLIDTIVEPASPENYNNLAKRYMRLYNRFKSSNIYNRIILDNSIAFIRIQDTVRENRLQRSRFTYKDRTPTVINKKTIIHNQRKFFVGSEFGINTVQPTVLYKDLSDVMYGVGYDLYGQDKGLRFKVYVGF